MKPSADLEISLHRHDAESYLVEFRFSQPDSDADIRLGEGEPALLRLDLKTLQDLLYDPLAYGKKLTEFFFTDSQVKSAFEQARASAQSLDASVRLRLLFGPSAPELNNLWWETLLDPKDSSPLYTDENLVFSRYLSSLDWRPVRLRPKGDLRALVVIANPTDLDENMAPIKVADELQRAQWDLDVEQWKIRACEMAGRNLTQAEWDKYISDKFVSEEGYALTCDQFPAGD